MNSVISRLALAAVAASLLTLAAGCSKPAEEPAVENAALSAPVPPGMVRGEALETMDSGGYTYVLMDTGQDQRWVASTETAVAIGDVVQTDAGMPMTGFTSKTLDRNFDVIYFVEGIQNLSRAPQSAAAEMPADHPKISSGDALPSGINIDPYEAGKDIAYVYANKDELAGSEVTVRGRVVKYNPGILERNFLHVQDGSGSAASGDNDLIVTTTSTTSVGETVVVTGTIALDKDFGAGYSYPVLLEDASLTEE